MRVIIKRNSKKFLFLLFLSIFAIIGGTITTVTTPTKISLDGLYLILAGIGLFFLTLSASTKDQKSFERWSIFSGIFYGIALLCGSLISFRYGQTVTAEIILLCGVIVISLTISSIVSVLRRGKQHV
jgi:hypothetical protein